MATGTGTATLDFGSAPGTNIVSIAVTGQTGIAGTDHVEAWMMGTSTTATHNAYEHMLAPIKLSVTAISAGTGFTVTGISEYRLTGTFLVHWVWAS
jgi:hypothetical protein